MTTKASIPARLRAVTLLAASFCQGSAFAHPGHSLNDASLLHIVSQPDHVLLLAVSAVVLWVSGAFLQRRWMRTLANGVAAVSLVLAGTLMGVRL